MKKLKRYQYERYAVLCELAYPRTFKQTRYGFDPNGQRIVNNRFGKVLMRILWSRERDEVIIVIKGSHNLWDWLLNSVMWLKSCKNWGLNYSIHAGFHYLLEQESTPAHKKDTLGLSVMERIEAIVKPLIENDKKRITITGHSSGGAIGNVIADYLEQRYPHCIKRVVTFGQPAVGSFKFRKNYQLSRRTYRICCDLDIVTFMPPLPFVYWHVGKLLWLYNGKIYENTPTGIRFVRSIVSWLIRPFSYHLMRKYIRNKDFFDER
ncbi:putative Lipase (class 3) [Vibrio nigripulchritudo MADA3029]|uniref:Lipase (Class 3) n=2 Tax=Vibrio nigripulchritudo TaxID=28173 RepID=A0AAV2VT77_9VIBR|nr:MULTISPECIES: lipase class 3 [Vibrio]KJY76409.1 lipase [Vibrio nigripulchritudo]UAB72453.1 lipase [Vibrio sp. SCSIO 43132]CCN33120.1 putative Lipase (class 3) [Vibrio nigripulchritudo AM115]CCN40806.1 putative Lipase (class 3) [Vibrio nigripulchritudo FTn2]CCN48609.1 putative Lipase (class 3) [Vibrio nigripulchritudo MADA3020]